MASVKRVTAALLLVSALASPALAQRGALRSVGRGPSVRFEQNLPSRRIFKTLGGTFGYATARDFARRVPPQRASYLAARGIVTSLARARWRSVTFEDLSPGVRPTGLEVVRTIATLDFPKRGRFTHLKRAVLALAERVRRRKEPSLEQLGFGFRQFMVPLPIVDAPEAGYGFFSRRDLVGGGGVDPAIFFDPFTEDVQKSLGEGPFLDLMEALLTDRPPPGGPKLDGLYDTQLAALANYLFGAGRFRWAGEAWAVLVRRDPTSSTAARGLGLALLAQRRFREAADAFRRSLRAAKGWPDGVRIVGSNLRDVFPDPAVLDDARAELAAQLARTPQAADLRFVLAFLDLFEGRLDEARKGLAALAESDPVARGLLGILERKAVAESVLAPMPDEVRRALARVTGLEEPALTPEERAHLIQVLREGPKTYEDYMRLGDFRFFMGEFTEASEAYRKAHKLRPEDPFALFALVHASFANGEFRQAARYLRRALAMEPDWPLFEFRLQEFYGSQEEYERHLKNLERQVRLRPDLADLKFLLAYVYYFSGRFSDAADLLAEVLRLEPGFERADYFLRLARLQD